MLEIFFLRWFSKSLADVAEGKGRSRAWGAGGVVLWIGSEIAGFVVGLSAGGTELSAYGFAIGAAVVSAVVSYGVVAALPDLTEPQGAPLQF